MDKKTVNLNGFIQDATIPLFYTDNRSFRYGDGLFETMRLKQGSILFSELHYGRLLKGMKMLKFKDPEKFSHEKMCEEILRLSRSARVHKSARIRLQVFREGAGYYTPDANSFSFLIELEKLDSDQYEAPEKGYLVDLFKDINLSANAFSPLKTANALPFVLAGIARIDKGLDENFLLNEKGNLVEGISTNIFLVKNNVYYTPALTEGCTDGVMRNVIIGLLKEDEFKVSEAAIPPASLEKADEVFLTNAVQGIRWVVGYRQKRYFNHNSRRLLGRLNEKVKALYEFS